MKKALAFSGSFSRASINQKLIDFTVSQLDSVESKTIELSSFETHLYTKERESEQGVPDQIKALRKLFDETDAFIISSPEYNGSLPAGFKNTLDWISRIDGKIFQDKYVLLMATSPGGRGGKSVLDHLTKVMPFWGAKIVGPFSLPKFNENFADSAPVEPYKSELKLLINDFEQVVSDS